MTRTCQNDQRTSTWVRGEHTGMGALRTSADLGQSPRRAGSSGAGGLGGRLVAVRGRRSREPADLSSAACSSRQAFSSRRRARRRSTAWRPEPARARHPTAGAADVAHVHDRRPGRPDLAEVRPAPRRPLGAQGLGPGKRRRPVRTLGRTPVVALAPGGELNRPHAAGRRAPARWP